MRLRKNRTIERVAVNKVRLFFEENGCIFQEVDLGNDYGKDAYVDLVDEEKVTGTCFALQIKGGASYRRVNGYGIPIDKAHATMWYQSTIPVIGIIYDPADDQLRWCNISNFLDELETDLPSYIPIDTKDILNAISLKFELRISLEKSQKWRIEHPILNLFSNEAVTQLVAIYDCFALSRSDVRNLIILRYTIVHLRGIVLLEVIRMLSHATAHPDIIWTEQNWITQKGKDKVQRHFVWNEQEICHILSYIDSEMWQRGDYGEDVYMLFSSDPNISEKMERVAIEMAKKGQTEVAFSALTLTLYWSETNALKKYTELLSKCPEIQTLPLAQQMEKILTEEEYVELF